MNIFVLDLDPARAASYLCDRHVPKMLLEAAQMLSTALHGAGAIDANARLYRPSHQRHPCTLWVGASRENAAWLVAHARAIAHEWRLRYGHAADRVHASEPVVDDAEALLRLLPDAPLSPHAQAMPPEYQHADPVLAYRAYYRGVKRSIARWRLGAPPWWDPGAQERRGSRAGEPQKGRAGAAGEPRPPHARAQVQPDRYASRPARPPRAIRGPPGPPLGNRQGP